MKVYGTAVVSFCRGALPKNIFWQVGGGVGVAIGTGADPEGYTVRHVYR